MAYFKYSRKQLFYKLDDEGKKIPKEIKEGDTNLNQPQFETEEIELVDGFNTSCVIRSVMKNKTDLVVLLNDGHEDMDWVETLKNEAKPPTPGNIIKKRQRVWLQSEIILSGDEITRFYNTMDK